MPKTTSSNNEDALTQTARENIALLSTPPWSGDATFRTSRPIRTLIPLPSQDTTKAIPAQDARARQPEQELEHGNQVAINASATDILIESQRQKTRNSTRLSSTARRIKAAFDQYVELVKSKKPNLGSLPENPHFKEASNILVHTLGPCLLGTKRVNAATLTSLLDSDIPTLTKRLKTFYKTHPAEADLGIKVLEKALSRLQKTGDVSKYPLVQRRRGCFISGQSPTHQN